MFFAAYMTIPAIRPLFELTSGLIAGVKSSLDGLMHELVILQEEIVGGRVTSLDADNNIIVLEDTEYAMSLDFTKKYITTDYIDIGDMVNAYLGLGGELVYLAERTSEYVYGMLSDAKSSDGMESALMLEIFTADGFTTMYAADKISFDSGNKLSDVSAALDIVSEHIKADKPEIIRYSTNADGEVTHIDFASDETSNTSYDPMTLRPEYDRLAKIKTVANINYRSDASGLVSNAILSDATMIVDNGANEPDRDKRYRFSSMGSLTTNSSYSMELYDIDEHGYAGFAFVTGGPTNGAKNTYLKTYIIEKANRGVSGDYEGYRLTCYGEGSYGSYFLPEESLNADITGKKRMPQPGDLIRFTIKSEDIIDEYYTDFVYEADNSLPMYKKVIGTYMEESGGNRLYGQLINNDTSGAASANGIYTNAGYGEAYIADLQGRYGAGFVTGYVYNSEKSIVLCNGGADYIMANMRPYTLPNTVVLFDTQARKVTVTPYMSSSFKSYKANSGEEDFVVLRCSAGKPQIAFVYR
ncbi:MAG: hypothetical protein IJ460_04130 [Clostridia bacterium]|nr:hypothetical protein [Clostridia bacterium]